MASKNVCCSIPTAILSAVTELRPCPTDIGQIQNLIFWRAGNSIASEATALLRTTWVTLLAATDNSKAVVTPLIDNPVFEGGEAREFGGGNETRNGKPHIKGGEPTLFSASIHKASQEVIRTIKGWSCEDIEVLFICEGNQLFYRQDGDLVKGFPIRSLFVSSLIPGGKINSDTNNLSFYLAPNWSDYGVLSTNSKNFDMLGIGLGIPFGGGDWIAYWTEQSEVLFFGLVSEISGGQMPNKAAGASDYLMVTGTPGDYTFECPNTAPYIAADTDYIWFTDAGTQRAPTSAGLIGYDYVRTPVKYDSNSPYFIEAIMILNSDVTGNKLNFLHRDMALSIWWSSFLNIYGEIKGNKAISPTEPLEKYLSKPLGTEYAYIADNNALDVKDDPFIICGWVKGDDKAASYYLFGKNIFGGVNGRYGFYTQATTGYLSAVVQQSTSSRTIVSEIDWSSGWHFLYMQVRQLVGGGIVFDFYVDNVLIGTSEVTGYAFGTLANQYEFYVGAGNSGTGAEVTNVAKGDFSDIRIYRTALTEEQRTYLFNKQDVSGYVARWKCDAFPLSDETENYDLTEVNITAENIEFF